MQLNLELRHDYNNNIPVKPHKAWSEVGRVYPDLISTTSEVEMLFPIDPRLKNTVKKSPKTET